LLTRILFSLCQFIKYRQKLKSYLYDKNNNSSSIENINAMQLYIKGIRALVIDFDGVLAAHSKIEPTDSAKQWLLESSRIFGKGRLFILSNNPFLLRSEYFSKHFPEICFVHARKKKPYPDAILDIIYQIKLQPVQILLIDDRLSVGILAAVIADVQACFISKPKVDFTFNLFSEFFLSCLRKVEQIWLKKWYVKKR